MAVIKIRLSPREWFDSESFDSREIVPGITGVWGREKVNEDDAALPIGAAPVTSADPNPQRLQSLQFDSEKWTLEKELDWMDKYGYQVNKLEFSGQWFSQATEEYVERNADLFKAGNYPDRGLIVTEEDIARLARSIPVGAVILRVQGALIHARHKRGTGRRIDRSRSVEALVANSFARH